MMTILGIILISQLVVLALAPQPMVGCVNGLIMEQHKDMWVQKGLLPQHCVLVDLD
jgi:hypothetical protein